MGANRSIVESFYEAYNSGSADLGAAVMDPQVKTVVPGVEPLEGPPPFQEYLAALKTAAPDSKLSMDSVIESGDVVVVEGKWTGTQSAPLESTQGILPASGREFEVPFACKFEVADGLIKNVSAYFDQVHLLTQLGMMRTSCRRRT